MVRHVRPSTLGLGLLVLAGLTLMAACLEGMRSGPEVNPAMARQVAAWGLTDLALFTEARYTRHPSQADRHGPFQDHPGALEHFPTGALLAPPAHLRVVTEP